MKFSRFDYAAFMLFMAYAVCSLLFPVVLVEVAKELNFDLDKGGMSAGGMLQLGRSIPMVAAMIICSMLAGRIGLRRSLILSAILMALGITLAGLSQWYWMLLVVLIIAGLGEGLIEGLATPFVGELHKDDEPGRYITFSHGFWSIGIFFCVPLLGLLLGVNFSWRLLCLFAALLALIPVFFLISPGKKQQKQMEGTGRFDAAGAWQKALAIFKCKQFWIFFAAMFFAGGGEFGATFWSASLLRLEYDASPFVGGLATAVFSAGMMLGRWSCSMFFRQYQLPLVIIIAAAAGVVLSLLFSVVQGVIMVMLLLFFVGLASASFWPSCQSYCVDRLSELDSTTLYIILSCSGVPGSGIFSAVMGKVGDLWGLRAAFLVVPFCYLILAILIMYDYFICRGRYRMKSLNQSAAVSSAD